MPEVQASLDDLIAKNSAALNRGRMELVERRAAQKVTVGQLRLWANFIDTAADGDLTVIYSFGFEARRAPSPSSVPAVPGNVRAAYGKNTGTMVVRGRGGRNVRNFSLQYGENAEGPWTDRPLSTKSAIEVPNLTPGTNYWFRMRANGAKGSSDWSAPVCKMAV